VRLSGAIQDLRRFCEKHSIPVVASRLGIDIFESSHPLFIGRIGNKGDRAGNFALQNADFIISIGSRLSVSSTGHEYDKFGREATLAAVDIDPVEHKKNTVRIDLFINADARRFLRSLKPGRLGDFSSWAGVCRRWKKMWPVCLPGYRQDKNGINLYYFVDKLSGKLKNDSVVVSDAGSAFYVASQGLQLKGAQRYITSGAQAEMGFTLPAAIGVCFARGKKEVIGITGDGSLQMNLQELQTVVYHKLPVKIFVWNNNGYLSIRATQAKFFGGRFIGTDKRSGVSFPDTAKLAVAYGISFYRVSASRQLSRVIGLVLREKRPVICEVICQSDQEIVPTVVSLRRSDGRLVSKPLEDMYPFLDRKTFHLEMLVRPLED
jgi:acetolactate synthase-1/2/3 large subunit